MFLNRRQQGRIQNTPRPGVTLLRPSFILLLSDPAPPETAAFPSLFICLNLVLFSQSSQLMIILPEAEPSWGVSE